jgi:hypothetical protein
VKRRKLLDAPSKASKSGGFPLIKELVARRDYLLTEKVYELLSQGEFELEDLEHSIQFGRVVKNDFDELKKSIGNKKYTIIGRDTHGYPFYSVGKIQRLDGGKKYLVITAHDAEVNYE